MKQTTHPLVGLFLRFSLSLRGATCLAEVLARRQERRGNLQEWCHDDGRSPRSRWSLAMTGFLLLILFCTPTMARPNALSLPRYASLRSNAVNLHVGPGTNYPVEWCYVLQNLPVEIIAEFDTWRQIRDWQGTEGWVHKSLLSGRRTVWVLHKVRPLRKSPDEKAKIIAQLQPGVIARVIECQGSWCKIEVKSKQSTYKGWIKRRCVWGVYPHETKFD